MTFIQSTATYTVIFVFLFIIGKILYGMWEEMEINRKHRIKKLKEDLEKEE